MSEKLSLHAQGTRNAYEMAKNAPPSSTSAAVPEKRWMRKDEDRPTRIKKATKLKAVHTRTAKYPQPYV